jgi:hypothetical protein
MRNDCILSHMTTTLTTSAAPSASKGLNIALWVAQALLFAAFIMAGGMKLVKDMPGMSTPLRLFIGVAEVLGALGMLLPSLSRVKPGLTPLAGVGLLVIMVLAAALHLSRGEVSHLPPVIVLGALAAFVAWGRWKKAPIAPKG